MWRSLFLFLCLGAPAFAQPTNCIDSTAVWTTQYSQGNIQAISYTLWQQSPPAPSAPIPLLTVIYRPGSPAAETHIHVNVPVTIAQPFTVLSSADQKYQATVQNRYQQLLLGEDLCPLLNETGPYLVGETP
jgi:hypothetical protein